MLNIKRRDIHTSYQNGYTLIELLIYVAILGALLTVVTFFFGTIASARIKDQTIIEVNDQGQALMDTITQTIHNATAITSPAIGTTGSSLSLAVPTGSLSPTLFTVSGTTLGYAIDGVSTDSSDKNFINATKFTASATGTILSLYAMVGGVAASPNDKGQMAIYSGVSSPSTLLASSSSTNLTANAWNAFSITTVAITSGQTYWLAYNTNAINSTDNNLKLHTGAANQSMYVAQTFNTWPASWTGTLNNAEFSMYAAITVPGTPATVQIKEGAGTITALTNNKVQVSNLSFKNLSRSGTPGSIQVSFTLSRVNLANRNEYEYQKAFIGSAEVAW